MTYFRLGLLAVLAILFLSMAAAMYKYRADATEARADAAQARADLMTAKAVIAANEKTLADLTRRAEADADLVADLQDELKVATDNTLALASSLAALKDANDGVKDFLNQLVPDDLRKLYDQPQAGSHR